MIKVNNENPNEHWQFVSVTNRIVLDLGCGRWEHVEHRNPNCSTTPEFFKQRGATHVVAIDCDPREINWFNSKFSKEENYEFILGCINSANDFSDLILRYNPNCVKIDIEGAESNIIHMSNYIFSKVDEYYIETHNQQLYESCTSKLTLCGYQITNIIDLVHTNGLCKVIFAKK